MKKAFIVDQTSCCFNAELLRANNWARIPCKNHMFEWEEYEKRWHIQDEEGGRYTVWVSLRQHENIALLLVNDIWMGRCLYLSEAENVVTAIKMGCK